MVAIEGIIGFFLVLGAGYWLITILLNKIKTEILDHFLQDAALANGLAYLTKLTLIVLVAAGALSQLGFALASEYSIVGYVSAISAPFNLVNNGIGTLWTLISVGALLFVGLSLANTVKKPGQV